MSVPRVSVIMAVRNEKAFIARSLGSVLAQDYPADRLEVIVADGMSEDGTRAEIEALQSANANLVVFSNPGRIVAAGLNAAIRRSSGEIVVRVDGHTEIAGDYVRQVVDALLRTGADNAGGRMNAVATNHFGQAVVAATSSRFGVGAARFHYSEREAWVDTVYLGAWRREVFDRIGLFDEELVRDQDDEFNYRLRASGGRILLTPNVKSLYTVRASPSRLWKQYFGYGLWKVRVLQKHPLQMQPRQFAPPVFAVSLLVLAALAVWSRLAVFALLLLSASYLSANLLASAKAAGGRLGRIPPLCLAFSILHLSYGFGFLTGLAWFAGRWRDRGPRHSISVQDRDGARQHE